jgi:hypothetical protein
MLVLLSLVDNSIVRPNLTLASTSFLVFHEMVPSYNLSTMKINGYTCTLNKKEDF